MTLAYASPATPTVLPQPPTAPAALTPRWYRLRPHRQQLNYTNSNTRFNAVHAGRRSGKSERAKRRLVKKAIKFHSAPDGRFIAAAPTHNQAKKIFWKDIKALVPKDMIVGKPSESELKIELVNGATIEVMGLDKPERAEGAPIDHILMDEYGNMKMSAWTDHVRPGLDTVDRPGTADFTGTPEGRNHFYQLVRDVADNPEWSVFHWFSADILPPDVIEQAKRDLDPLTYQQEYEGSFVSFEGRAYYNFIAMDHAVFVLRPLYNPFAELILCFDFNVDPGVCAICQESDKDITLVLGEVYIPQNSNTPAVCRKIIADWGKHVGPVSCYGDATGGARGTAKVFGSDWDLIKMELGPHFGNRLRFFVPKKNPNVRDRINAVNSRVKSMDGKTHILVDPQAAPHVVADLEGVRLLKGGSGELDKKYDMKLTHISDGLGYYIARRFPVRGPVKTNVSRY